MGYLTVVLGALLIRVGFAIHSAGMARSKNSAGAVMRQLCDLCMAVLAFWAVGNAIVASRNSFFGLDWHELFGNGDAASTAMVLIATGIVPGVLAERARFWPPWQARRYWPVSLFRSRRFGCMAGLAYTIWAAQRPSISPAQYAPP